MSILNVNRHCDQAIVNNYRMSMLQDQRYTQATCNAKCAATQGCTVTALFTDAYWHGRCDLFREACPANRYNWVYPGMSTSYVGSGQYGKTYVKNYQAAGETNFNNSADRGDTQVDNLSGLAGSVQNFGLMNLAAADDLKKKIADLTKARKALNDKRDAALDKLGEDPTMDGL